MAVSKSIYGTYKKSKYNQLTDHLSLNNDLCREYCIEIRRVLINNAEPDPVRISSPEDVFHLLSESRFLDREIFYCLHLNTKNKLLSLEEVSKGSLNAALVHPREVYKAAILRSAAGIILAHNHPSGDPIPSREDKDLTKRFSDAGDIIGIDLLDHVILGIDQYYSMREHGEI